MSIIADLVKSGITIEQLLAAVNLVSGGVGVPQANTVISSGKVASATAARESVPRIMLAKPTGAVSGQAGRYTGKTGWDQITVTTTASAPAKEADIATFATANDCYIWRVGETAGTYHIQVGYHPDDGKPVLVPLDGGKLIWVKIVGNETGGGKYTGKSYTHDGTSDVSASGNLAESELGTLSSTVDCRVLNFAEEGQSTHDLTSGTPAVDTFLCHWFRTNSDGIKVCAVVAYDRETCA